jgi:hypothetical protein
MGVPKEERDFYLFAKRYKAKQFLHNADILPANKIKMEFGLKEICQKK